MPVYRNHHSPLPSSHASSPGAAQSTSVLQSTSSEASCHSNEPGHKELTSSKDSETPDKTVDELIRKLYQILDDNLDPDTISWTPRGDAFMIRQLDKFARTILRPAFMHANISVFARELEEYGFHREVEHLETANTWTFRHPHFRKNIQDALYHIHRRPGEHVIGFNITHHTPSSLREHPPHPPLMTEPIPSSRDAPLDVLLSHCEHILQQQSDTEAYVIFLCHRLHALRAQMAGLRHVQVKQWEAMQQLAGAYAMALEAAGMSEDSDASDMEVM